MSSSSLRIHRRTDKDASVQHQKRGFQGFAHILRGRGLLRRWRLRFFSFEPMSRILTFSKSQYKFKSKAVKLADKNCSFEASDRFRKSGRHCIEMRRGDKAYYILVATDKIRQSWVAAVNDRADVSFGRKKALFGRNYLAPEKPKKKDRKDSDKPKDLHLGDKEHGQNLTKSTHSIVESLWEEWEEVQVCPFCNIGRFSLFICGWLLAVFL